MQTAVTPEFPPIAFRCGCSTASATKNAERIPHSHRRFTDLADETEIAAVDKNVSGRTNIAT